MKVNIVVAKTVKFGKLETGTFFRFVKHTDIYPEGVYIKTDIRAINSEEFHKCAVNIDTGKSIEIGYDKECIPLKISTTIDFEEGFYEPHTDWVKTDLRMPTRDGDIPVVDVTTDEYLKWVYNMTVRRGGILHRMNRSSKTTEDDIIKARNLFNFYTLVANVTDEQNGHIQDSRNGGSYYGGKVYFKLHDKYFAIRADKDYVEVSVFHYDSAPDWKIPELDWEE